VAPNPTSGLASGTSITFTAQGASDPELTFNWDFGDGTTGTGSPVSHTYANAGTFNATVTVSDGKKSATASGSVTIRNLTGAWTGTIVSGTASLNFSMSLSQTGSAVSGSYSDQFGPGTVSGTVTGGNAVRLVATQTGFVPSTFRAPPTTASPPSMAPFTGFVGAIPTFTMRR
jgi:hypothetical protein